jgi:transmembrane sensor
LIVGVSYFIFLLGLMMDMEEKDKNSIDDLIVRNLLGSASNSEQEQLDCWIAQTEENRIYFNQFKILWETSGQMANYQQIETETSLKKVKQRIGHVRQSGGKIKPLWIALRIAAILVLFFGIYLIFKQKSFNENDLAITTIESVNQVKDVVLPDGSRVWLNKRSKLEYAENFNTKERRVKLDGEAFFEIKPNSNCPFVIETSRSETRVLGTAFNLRAYSSMPSDEIVVSHGKVEFKDKLGNIEQKLVLEKDEMARIDSILVKTKIENLNYLAWKTGIFQFKNEPLPEVVKFLSDYYQVEILIKDNSISGYLLTGTYEHLNVNEMLEILELTLGIKTEGDKGKYWLTK